MGIPNKDQVNTMTLVQDFNEKAKGVAVGT